MDLELAGRRAVVGASSQGLGFETARALAEEGVRVLLTGRDADKLEEAVREIGHGADGIVADLSRVEGARALVGAAIERLETVDIVVLNVGGPPPGLAGSTDLEELRRALHDLADASLERRAATVFRRRLAELDDDRRDELRRARDDGAVRIATAFEPDDDLRSELTDAVRDVLGDAVEPHFEREPELGFGVALQVGGVRVGWTAEGYARGLEEAFDDALGELRGQPMPAPEAVEGEAEALDAD